MMDSKLDQGPGYAKVGTRCILGGGRPFSLRDSERAIRWTEWHEPFGATNTFQSPGDPKTAGSGDYAITWEPGFRFPGQFEAPFENLIPTAQNHYREYLPW